jgi:hypothetical protein
MNGRDSRVKTANRNVNPVFQKVITTREHDCRVLKSGRPPVEDLMRGRPIQDADSLVIQDVASLEPDGTG